MRRFVLAVSLFCFSPFESTQDALSLLGSAPHPPPLIQPTTPPPPPHSPTSFFLIAFVFFSKPDTYHSGCTSLKPVSKRDRSSGPARQSFLKNFESAAVLRSRRAPLPPLSCHLLTAASALLVPSDEEAPTAPLCCLPRQAISRSLSSFCFVTTHRCPWRRCGVCVCVCTRAEGEVSVLNTGTARQSGG